MNMCVRQLVKWRVCIGKEETKEAERGDQLENFNQHRCQLGFAGHLQLLVPTTLQCCPGSKAGQNPPLSLLVSEFPALGQHVQCKSNGLREENKRTEAP